MERDRERTEKDIASVVYYMNGGLNFADAYGLDTGQLTRLSNVITEHHEKQAEAYKQGSSKRS
jgi:hypothetical protein